MTAAAGPPSRPAVPARLYSTELLQHFAGGEHERFLLAGGRPLRPRLARALALAGLRPGLRVADIGTGRGEAAAHAARRGAHVIAIDFSLDALGLARRSARAAGGAVRAVAARAERLPLPAGSVDRVLLLDVIEHLHPHQAAAALAEAGRILAPGGYVVIHTLPNRWALAVGYRALRLVDGALPSDPRSGYERCVHVNEQDPLRLRRLLGGAGLAHRVWVEEWTSRHAAVGQAHQYPDPARAVGYRLLRRPRLAALGRLAMATPARWVVANDVFALAWPRGAAGPPSGGRFGPCRSGRH